jgi:hypothetical protein
MEAKQPSEASVRVAVFLILSPLFGFLSMIAFGIVGVHVSYLEATVVAVIARMVLNGRSAVQ